MQPIPYSEQEDWIARWLLLPRRDGALNIGNLLPARYEAYCQILHPIHENREIESWDLTWNDVTAQSGGIVLPLVGNLEEFQKKHGLAGTAVQITGSETSESADLHRIHWLQIADRFGASLVSGKGFADLIGQAGYQSWPRRLVGPREGSMDSDAFVLLEVLADFSPPDTPVTLEFCSFSVDPVGVDTSQHGPLGSVAALLESDAITLTPEWWWPDDRSWLIHTDYDCTWTAVCGTHELIAAVMAHPDLECLPIDEDTHLTF